MKHKRLGTGITLMSVVPGLVSLLAGCGNFWAAPTTTTTTTLTSSSYSTTAGTSFTLTGTVKISSSGDTATAATSTIEFYDKTTSTNLGTVSISSGVATLTTSLGTVATHSIEAIYSGDMNYSTSSSSAISIVISSSSGSNIATTTLLTSTSYSTTAGTNFTLTATVLIASSSDTATGATGTIKFYDTTTSTGLGTEDISSGVATLTTSLSAVETHVIEAIYTTGDTNYASSTSSTISVAISSASSGNEAATVTMPTSTNYSSTSDPGFTLTGTVKFRSSCATAAADTVTIECYDTTTSTNLGTVSVSSGVATPTNSLSGRAWPYLFDNH